MQAAHTELFATLHALLKETQALIRDIHQPPAP